MRDRTLTSRSLLSRRAFCAMVAASAGALGARLYLLPRPLSDEQVAALAVAPSTPRPASGQVLATPGPLDEEAALAPDFRESNHTKVQEVGLVPRRPKWRKVFKINTVEREPQKGLDDWTLTIDGLVERPMVLDRSALYRLPSVSQVSDFHCVEGWSVRDVRWGGVRIQTLLDLVRPRPEAQFIAFHTLAGVYSDSLAIEQALEPDVLLAYELNGDRLPDRQGYPLRLVVPAMFGYKSVKWVNRIELSDRRVVGFWERRGWPIDPWV